MMKKDRISFTNRSDALDFYLIALSLGIWADYDFHVSDNDSYYVITIDKEKTFEKKFDK